MILYLKKSLEIIYSAELMLNYRLSKIVYWFIVNIYFIGITGDVFLTKNISYEIINETEKISSEFWVLSLEFCSL